MLLYHVIGKIIVGKLIHLEITILLEKWSYFNSWDGSLWFEKGILLDMAISPTKFTIRQTEQVNHAGEHK